MVYGSFLIFFLNGRPNEKLIQKAYKNFCKIKAKNLYVKYTIFVSFIHGMHNFFKHGNLNMHKFCKNYAYSDFDA